jgi:DNA polymerase III subunit chi
VTAIDFYFNAEDRLQVACRLAAKACGQKKRLLIYAPEADTASRIDRMLWTWQATGFLPHCAADGSLAAETPVLISAGDETPPDCPLLLNLAADCPPHFARFERLFEVVAADDAERAAGRARYRFYQERGYKIANHDLAGTDG